MLQLTQSWASYGHMLPKETSSRLPSVILWAHFKQEAFQVCMRDSSRILISILPIGVAGSQRESPACLWTHKNMLGSWESLVMECETYFFLSLKLLILEFKEMNQKLKSSWHHSWIFWWHFAPHKWKWKAQGPYSLLLPMADPSPNSVSESSSTAAVMLEFVSSNTALP